MTDFESLVERMRTHVGDALLGLGWYDTDSYEVIYVSDNFATRYPEDKLADIAHDMYLEHISGEYQETLLYDFGELRGTLRLFEEGVAFHVPTGETTGFGFGVEIEAMPEAVALIDVCLEFADEQQSART